MGTPETVTIDLLNYHFVFNRLYWKSELGIKIENGQEPTRVVLAHALANVSGLVPESRDKAQQVMDAVPEAIRTRVWMVYRGSLPPARRFSVAELYKAPPPTVHMMRVQEDEGSADSAHDRAVREMESRFGKAEVAEEAELSRKILAAAQRGKKFAGAGPATQDGIHA